MEDLCAARIIEKVYQPVVVLPLKNLRVQMFQGALDAHRPPPQHGLQDCSCRTSNEQRCKFE